MKTGTATLAFLFLLFSCNTTEPPPPPLESTATITLTVEDVGVTEAWLRVVITDTVASRTFLLNRDHQVDDTIRVFNPDTVVLDDNLLPNRGYTYKAYRLQAGMRIDSTESVQVTTLDSTSHDFAWEVLEFGEHSSSVLLDVAIINENDIWAVGEIFMNDSIGNSDPDSYNAVHWNGDEWQVLRVPVQICVVGLLPDTILFTEGGNLVIWDGLGFTQDCLPNGLILGTLREMWASSLSDIYLVGGQGTIVHNNGASWQRIESGTSADINDVWGGRGLETGKTVIIAGATTFGSSGEILLLEILDDGTTSPLSWEPHRSIESVWFTSPDKIFVAGGSVFVGMPGGWEEIPELSMYYSEKVRGSDRNNGFAVGHFGLIGHYNGASWKYYSEFFSNGIYYSTDVSERVMVAVGQIGSQAVVLRGSRP